MAVLVAMDNLSVVGAYWVNFPLYLLFETYFCFNRFGEKDILFQITQQARSSAHIRSSD